MIIPDYFLPCSNRDLVIQIECFFFKQLRSIMFSIEQLHMKSIFFFFGKEAVGSIQILLLRVVASKF